MTKDEQIKVLTEMVKFIDGSTCNFPSWWFEEEFTTKEFGDEMLSCHSWWEKKLKQLE